MKLSKLGVEALEAGCGFCGAKPGELCGTGMNERTPLEASDHWEHGVHYGRGQVPRCKSEAPVEEPMPEDVVFVMLRTSK
ncbi:MAG: hypothetical protein L0Z53_06675 [Acidobacteriales bacterium]|nr:hypothetical protein [Terriglobales bacterium]